MRTVVALMIGAMLLSGCEQTGPKQNTGTLLGAGAGALLGSAIASHDDQGIGIVMGAAVGAMLGSGIGKSLDDADRAAMQKAQYSAFERNPSGTSSYWSNPDSGNSGYVTPRPAVRNDEGQYCREFTQEIIVGGKKQTGYGKACRQPDGTWKIVSER